MGWLHGRVPRLQHVERDAEPYSLGVVLPSLDLSADERVHADDFTPVVEERASAVARVDGGVGLHVLDAVEGPEGGHDSPRDGHALRQVEGEAKRYDALTLPHRGRELKRREIAVGFHLQQRDVTCGVRREHAGLQPGAVVEHDRNAG